MKLLRTRIWILLSGIVLFGIIAINFLQDSCANSSSWVNFWSSPITVLDNFANRVNEDQRVQDNQLNDISNIQWQYASEYKITNTLDSIRIQIAPYIQWIMYIGLSVAVILIIYNGLLMVTNGVHDQWSVDKLKTRMLNIAVGVGILTWFYLILQLALALISYLLA